MKPHVRRWMEKVQVQVAVAAAVAVGWFVGWPLVRPWDPHGALAFVPTGEITRLAVFAGAMWVLSAGCALLTLSARTEGALLAAMAGATGFGLRSGSMATLLQQTPRSLPNTFALLAAETVAMGAVLVGALLVVTLVRAVAGKVVPGWVWPGAAGASEPQQDEAGEREGRLSSAAGNLAGCLVVELAVAIIALTLTFRSIETGQIAFALAGSFFLAALVAHQTFPVKASAPFWIAPLAVGVAILALGGLVAEGSGPGWYQAMVVARGLPLRAALPVHWLGLGCGGSLAGMWVSRRMRDAAETERAR